MTQAQKVIKYLAMAFAILLCVTIIGGIVAGISGVMYLFSDHSKVTGDMKQYPIAGEVSSLSVDLGAAELRIQTAGEFSVESNYEDISVRCENGKLRIQEKTKLFSIHPDGIMVIVNVPRDFVFREAEIDTGAGRVRIDTLSAETLELSLGAGETIIENLMVSSRANIDGGAGVLRIRGGVLHNLDLEMGVGELTLKCRMEGKSSLDMGVGEANLTLIGSLEDYRIELDKGIGQAKLQGSSMKDDGVYGTGRNEIEIDGGVGAIHIDFSQE